ncbi:hypothetical protein BDC45DRAFT_496970 [Circinella umbellata]|nr:hypothetical protein BDC45DRAFT_496970 [Circinella umbellata]
MPTQLSSKTTLPIYNSIPQNTCIVLSHSEKFLQTRVADSVLISDEIDQFLNDCDQILAVLSKIQFSCDQQETFLSKKCNTLTKCIINRVQITKSLASKILNQDQKQEKSSENYIKWVTIDRPLLSKQLYEYVQTDADAILQRINDLHFQYQFDEASKQQDITSLREFMTSASYLFWTTTFDRDSTEGSWEQFIYSYQTLYGVLDISMLQFMENLLCNNEHKVTIDRFILALCKYNNQFPFPKDTVQLLNQDVSKTKSISEEGRIQLTKIALELVEKFSEAKMRDHFVTIYTWYRGCDKKNKKQMRDRADQWGLLVKERRSFISENKRELLQEKHEDAERIDQARRAVFFFYEQFMIMWRAGDATREILEEINFPGKGRIRDFLNFVAPLDQANYYVVMRIDKDVPTKDYRPKLYDFMDTYLSMLVQKSKE